MTNDEALEEIYDLYLTADNARKTAENGMQAAMVYALALGRIALTLKRMGYDIED